MKRKIQTNWTVNKTIKKIKVGLHIIRIQIYVRLVQIMISWLNALLDSRQSSKKKIRQWSTYRHEVETCKLKTLRGSQDSGIGERTLGHWHSCADGREASSVHASRSDATADNGNSENSTLYNQQLCADREWILCMHQIMMEHKTMVIMRIQHYCIVGRRKNGFLHSFSRRKSPTWKWTIQSFWRKPKLEQHRLLGDTISIGGLHNPT